MSKWEEKRLEDIVDVNPIVKLTKEIEYPFIDIDKVSPTNKFVTNVESKVYIGQSSSKFCNGDTVFSRITPCLENRKIAKVKIINKPAFGSTEFYVFRAKDGVSDKDFIYYLTSSDSVVLPAINSMTGASGRQRADKRFIKKLKLHIPDLPTQKRIADILSTYDDLIENNNRRIELLEKSAQDLYKEWFVRFRFPNHENIKFVNGLPEGWSETKLDNVIEINKRSIEKSLQQINYIDLGSVNIGKINSINSYNINEAPSRARRVAKDGDIIWGMVRPNLKSYALILNPKQNDIFSTGFAVLSPKFVPFTFLYNIVTKNEFIDYLQIRAGGSAYPAVNADDFKKYKFILPCKKLLNQFHCKTEKNYRMINELENQNQNLKKQRDLLLPRLMSGKLEV